MQKGACVTQGVLREPLPCPQLCGAWLLPLLFSVYFLQVFVVLLSCRAVSCPSAYSKAQWVLDTDGQGLQLPKTQ